MIAFSRLPVGWDLVCAAGVWALLAVGPSHGWAETPAAPADSAPPDQAPKGESPPAGQSPPKSDAAPAPSTIPAEKLAAPIATAGPAPDAFAQQASWQMPAAAQVRKEAFAWLDERQPSENVRHDAEALWPTGEDELTGEALLVRLAATFALADPQAKELVELCRHARTQVAAPEFAWLAAETTPTFERSNLRLLLGRWLVHEQMADEALAQLEGLQPGDVVDPAGLLFYQGVVGHRLLKQDLAVAALKRLLERIDDVPRRQASLARLMLADLKGLEDESLDHIARRMQDIERRLDLGRAGPKVRDVEDGVIRSLDKLIEEMEKQQQAAMAAAGAAGRGGIHSFAPAPESRILTGKGAGQVDKKNIGAGGGWGDLPPKQRQEAMQQIGKDYPAHYRDLIEQYFRRLASEDEPIDP